MSELPTGTVTFLFTDIEGSTARWEQQPAEMDVALALHNEILRDALHRHGGVLYETAGDSFVVAFASAPAALEMAVSSQHALTHATWPAGFEALRVRMAIHTGAAELRDGVYVAQHTLSRQARILAVAHGGQVLVSRPSFDLVADHLPPDVTLRDLGELWLKDLIEPEHVFQVVASEPTWSMPADFPPLRGRDARPGNVPIPALPFIGRADTVEEIAHMVTEGPLRATTLLGSGGIGKTRLALRTAERVQHRFPDGVFFVDLASVTEPEMVAPAIAAVIGLDQRDGQAAVDALEHHLSDRELLLVLDNLEQVVDAAPRIASLLAAGRRLRILATSRIPLQILGEAQYSVAPMRLPDPDGPVVVEQLAKVEAVALFVERACAAKPSFALTSDNAATVAAICRRLEGIPLALVLAAARSKVLTPASMLARLDDRLGVLTGGATDLPARHQTLRNTLEWSYDLLDDDQKSLYAQWSVFDGGFRIESADAVRVGDGDGALDVLDGITALVDNSLLIPDDTSDGDTRYRMLETINEHASERLHQQGDAELVEQLHAQHFLELVEQAAPHLEGEHIENWTLRLEEEHDNLRAALARGVARCDRGDPAAAPLVVRLTAALSLFWHDRGHLTEGEEHLERGLALVPIWNDNAADADERRQVAEASAEICDRLGSIARRRGDRASARHFFEASLATYRELGDLRGQGRVLASLGTVSFHEDDLEDARRYYEHSLELSRAAGDRFNQVNLLLSLGNLDRDGGDHESARSLYEQCLSVSREIHEIIGESVALNNLANLALTTGDPVLALDLHRHSLEIRHRIGFRIMLAESMVGIASADIALGRTQRAARLIGYAEYLADAVGGTFDPMERRLHEEARTTLDAELGEERHAALREAGRWLRLDAAVALALEPDDGEPVG
ncbi:MAG: ATP-binding protein [Ilumatobacter sp.]|uniref:ATP-binding protein n=1 Tax=Ilumatobacter sp. TaxID=1967498 RepID=UPI00391DD40C